MHVQNAFGDGKEVHSLDPLRRLQSDAAGRCNFRIDVVGMDVCGVIKVDAKTVGYACYSASSASAFFSGRR